MGFDRALEMADGVGELDLVCRVSGRSGLGEPCGESPMWAQWMGQSRSLQGTSQGEWLEAVAEEGDGGTCC